jgi:hypothetical protein
MNRIKQLLAKKRVDSKRIRSTGHIIPQKEIVLFEQWRRWNGNEAAMLDNWRRSR